MLVQAVKKSFLSAVQCILVFLTVCHFTSNHTANWTDLKRVCSLAVLLVEECNKDKWAAVNTVTDRTGSEVNELWELLVMLAIKNTEPREMIYIDYIYSQSNRTPALLSTCSRVISKLVTLLLWRRSWLKSPDWESCRCAIIFDPLVFPFVALHCETTA